MVAKPTLPLWMGREEMGVPTKSKASTYSRSGYYSQPYSSWDEAREIQPMSEREMATLIEELGEHVVSEMLAENLPACRKAAVWNRLHAAGPTRLIGKYVVDGKGAVYYVTGFNESKYEWDGERYAWDKKEKKKVIKQFVIPPEAVAEVL